MSEISVVVPAKNAAKTIESAIDSIAEQKYLKEIIVVDDQSSDDTWKIAENHKCGLVRVLPNTGGGIPNGLNTGFFASKGKYVARCDADDLYVSGRLSWQRDWLESQPDYVAVSSGFEAITESGRFIASLACEGEAKDVTDILLNATPVTHFCGWLIRQEAVIAIGGARNWFMSGQDVDLQFRLAEAGRVYHIPNPGYKYRLHDKSIVHSTHSRIIRFYNASAREFCIQRKERGSDDLDAGRPPPLPEDDGSKSVQHISTASQHASQLYEAQAWRHFDCKEYRHAIKSMCNALRHDCLNHRRWRRGAILFVKSSLRLHRE